ncbi:M81 family metallopeptidase [Burkholderia sp. 22PA0099]|uniref:M81 family metallopeptidase n=1 Tax=Burkholderia sp. 22PA0099 TaxID=3237372 RepID=UPI0039C26007
MKRILIAGFQHETNTFASTRATYQNFVDGESFPAMRRGEALFELRDVNLPIGGFLQGIEAFAYRLQPVIWAGACPSAHVTDDAFERIAGEMVEGARELKPDGIYLDLHGAAVCESIDDAEGELLRRLREVVGPGVPIVASLDLHANVTRAMLDHADGLIAYRTYPHVDMAATGTRAAHLLHRLLSGHAAPLQRYSRRIPFLIPINAMVTQHEPARSTYALLDRQEAGGLASLSFAPGFPAADFPECGGVVWGYGEDAASLAGAVDALYDQVVGNEPAWAVSLSSADEAVAEALRLAHDATRPVVISDTQDNSGAGADSNTMGMVRALLAAGARDAAVGLIWDPEAARRAHQAGVGASITLALGGRSGIPGDAPLEATFKVTHLSDGRLRYGGPMKHGLWTRIGPAVGLEIDGVRIGVSSLKAQMIDRNLFRAVGIEPERMRIVVVKSSVHFRADFEPIAQAVLVAKAPGPMAADPTDLPWQRLAPSMRTGPNGPAFSTR